MELYKRIIGIIDANLIYCLIPIILSLSIVELFFKNRFETKKTLNLIRWIIIIYSIITWTIFLIEMTHNWEESAFINRVTDTYKAVYWIMFLSTFVLPFTLFIKKLAAKFWYVLFVAFFMKIGVYFERFVIITTGIHRDYLPQKGNIELMNSISFGITMLFLQGITIAILILGIFEITKRKNQ